VDLFRSLCSSLQPGFQIKGPEGGLLLSKVLLIDDEEGILLIGQRILGDLGCEVTTATNVSAALKIFAKDKFALVITDLKIPGQEGICLVQEIRELNPAQPVLIISGGDLKAEWFIKAVAEAGNINTLSKPFEIERFVDLVSQILKFET
jgi:DNA-binding NtrC family response regulator